MRGAYRGCGVGLLSNGVQGLNVAKSHGKRLVYFGVLQVAERFTDRGMLDSVSVLKGPPLPRSMINDPTTTLISTVSACRRAKAPLSSLWASSCPDCDCGRLVVIFLASLMNLRMRITRTNRRIRKNLTARTALVPARAIRAARATARPSIGAKGHNQGMSGHSEIVPTKSSQK